MSKRKPFLFGALTGSVLTAGIYAVVTNWPRIVAFVQDLTLFN